MNDDLWPCLAAAVAEDAESLAVLHDRELDANSIATLRHIAFPASLSLMPATPAAAGAWELMTAAVKALPRGGDPLALEALAAEYAAIYLTDAYGASPCESAWTDDERPLCQDSLFEMRALLAAAGLSASDWRDRPDDHLAVQILYIAHIARRARRRPEWEALARMLDEHMLHWLPDFAARLAVRAELPFYASLGALTAAWIDTLRDLLARHLGEPRPSREEVQARLNRAAQVPAEPIRFMPGAGPGW